MSRRGEHLLIKHFRKVTPSLVSSIMPLSPLWVPMVTGAPRKPLKEGFPWNLRTFSNSKYTMGIAAALLLQGKVVCSPLCCVVGVTSILTAPFSLSGGNPPRWNIAPNGCPHRHSGEHSNHSNTKIDNPDKHLPQSEGQTSPSTTTTAHSRDSTECGRVRSGSDSTLRSDSATPIPGQERETPPAGDGKTPLIEDGGVFPMVDGLGHITQYQEDTPSLDQTTPTTETSKVLPDQVQTPGELSSFHGYLSTVSFMRCPHSLVQRRKRSARSP